VEAFRRKKNSKTSKTKKNVAQNISGRSIAWQLASHIYGAMAPFPCHQLIQPSQNEKGHLTKKPNEKNACT